jgi:hypothetical protein
MNVFLTNVNLLISFCFLAKENARQDVLTSQGFSGFLGQIATCENSGFVADGFAGSANHRACALANGAAGIFPSPALTERCHRNLAPK